MKKRERNKAKRSERYSKMIATMSDNVTTETGHTVTKHVFLIGKVDGKVIYTSKVLRSNDHLSRIRRTWLRRISKRLLSKLEKGK